MGFYGNITNTSRTQFQFDKIYPSRRVMEESMNGDGVFVGRYVLVEYDSDVTNVYKQQLYRKDGEYYGDNKEFYYLYVDADCITKVQYKNATEDDTSINYGVNGSEAYKGAIAYVVEGGEDPRRETSFYQCVGQDGAYAVFQYIDDNSNYVFNYSQDKEWATEKGYSDVGRGWDSTVWQKVYVSGVERYVMIAELNSVVPTFDISADAPSISPMTPHFDENSTNVYYNLHWQPQWGIRVKSAYNDLKGDVLEDSGATDELVRPILLSSVDDNISYPSDATINWDKYEYDKKTGKVTHYAFGLLNDNDHDGKWVNINDTSQENQPKIVKAEAGIPAAIYFNKDGLNVNKITKSSDLFNETYRQEKFNHVSAIDAWPNRKFQDSIRLAPTGLSGHKYNQHAGVFDKRPNVDTYEFSMMLPSLGDTISDIWDMIYGGRNIDAIGISNTRNLDISWEDASQGQSKAGLRLVKPLDEGGFSYDVNQVNTLAGCINSAHDIMGMIIQDTRLEETNPIDFTDQETLNNLSSENIYYYGGAYYRKRKYYDYLAASGGNNDLKDYEQVNLTEFEEDKYYDKVISNYLLLNEPPEDNHTVYTLNGTPEKVSETGVFSQNYEANKFYYRMPALENSTEFYNYHLETSPVQSNTREYVSLFNFNSDGEYVPQYDEHNAIISAPVPHSYYFYRPGAYYYFESEEADPSSVTPIDTDDEQTSPNPSTDETPIADDSEHIVSGRHYYARVIMRERDIVTNEWIETYRYSPVSSSQLVEFEQNKYYRYNDGVYQLIINRPSNLETGKFEPTNCYTLPYISDAVYFYQAGMYYYISNNNYLLDTNDTYTDGRVYYKVPSSTKHADLTFYKPDTYYVTDNAATEPGENAVTTSDAFDSSKVYWKKADWYVASDANNIYAIGMKWDKSVDIPTGVTLCNRAERWGVEELEGFATNINTMLGMILRIRAMLDEEHSDTRDNSTVQGCINLINDIIAKFGERKVTDVMITNNYGQVAGARQTTAQLYQYNNIGTGVATPSTLQGVELTDEDEDQWIYWNIDPTYSDPVITLKHRLVSEMNHAAAATTTTADLNNTSSGNGLNKGNTDTLELYTPIVDIAGHVVGQNTETVTLPYGFKTIKVTNDSTTVTDAASTILASGQIADNTQDTLTFAASNKWVKFDNNTEDTIKIGHAVNTINTTSNGTTNLNTETGATNEENINIPDFTYDEAGHITSKQSHTYTLPFGFKILKSLAQSEDGGAWSTAAGAELNIVADSTQDTLSIASGNKWIRIVADTTNDKLTFAHLTSTATAGNYGDSTAQTPNFGSTFNVPYITIDVAGHVTGISAHTVTIPKGSLVDAEKNGADVITQLAFTDTTGKLETTRANIGTLKLTGYVIGSTTGVDATDSLNSAFGKLQFQANQSTNAITVLNGADTVTGSVSEKIKTAITNLDLANTYEAKGAAAAVLGTSADAATANTVYGAKAYADSLVSEIPECDATTDGTYVLKCTISSGEKTYEWIEEV